MLRLDVERYSALQRTVGYKFVDQSISLKRFAEYATAKGDEFVRIKTVLDWVTQQTSFAKHRHALVGRVRQFALAMQAEDQRHEVPPKDCVGRVRKTRKPPYIYSADDIDLIMSTARQVPPRSFILPETLTTLLGLLTATGLRISEALSLQCADIGADGLIIRKSKRGKTRLVPLHETTQTALEGYLKLRARWPVYTQTVFVSRHGQALQYSAVLDAFLRLMVGAGLRQPSLKGGPRRGGPRIHDLRHTFAVRSLEQCWNDRQTVAQHTIALTTYLGHTSLRDTYWYLEATPTLMSGIARAAEAMHKGCDA